VLSGFLALTIISATARSTGLPTAQRGKLMIQWLPSTPVARAGTRIGAGQRALRIQSADPQGLPTTILFERASSKLRKNYSAALQRHIAYLQAYEQTATFVLSGHANLRNSEPTAVKLARERARAVATRLRELGIGANKIKILSHGSAYAWDVAMGGNRPLKWNRRVEITINLDPSRSSDRAPQRSAKKAGVARRSK
jgi:outer membrane protein OmpA-like peptidoglycan-associated protein